MFNPLTKENIEKIAALQLDALKERLRRRGYELRWDKDIESYIADAGFDPVFGARPIKRCIQNEIENELSKALLSGRLFPDTPIWLSVKEGRIHVGGEKRLISE